MSYLVAIEVGRLVGRLVAPDRATVAVSDGVELRTSSVIPSSKSVLGVAGSGRIGELLG